MHDDLSNDEFTRIAAPKSTRITTDQAHTLVALPVGERPRMYAYWRDQIVSVPSAHYLDKYETEARAYWVSHTTIADLIRPA